MSRRLTFIVIWGVVAFSVSATLLIFLVFTNELSFLWLVPVLGLGLPTAGLVFALLGLLPGSRAPVQVLVRLLPASNATFVRAEAVPVRSGLYRIISAIPGGQPWEFSSGETIHCSEQVLPDGEKGLVAVMRA